MKGLGFSLCLERPYKWRPLPEVPFKGAKKPFGIRPLYTLLFKFGVCTFFYGL